MLPPEILSEIRWASATVGHDAENRAAEGGGDMRVTLRERQGTRDLQMEVLHEASLSLLHQLSGHLSVGWEQTGPVLLELLNFSILLSGSQSRLLCLFCLLPRFFSQSRFLLLQAIPGDSGIAHTEVDVISDVVNHVVML